MWRAHFHAVTPHNLIALPFPWTSRQRPASVGHVRHGAEHFV